ncbi:MAG: NfeD family protein [Actinobacteria bacterium]|nr:NfeD family protein [Actinomycetota bacterium]
MGGQALVEGAWWNLRSETGPLEPGLAVQVTDVDGLDLVVRPESPPPEAQSANVNPKEPDEH